MRYSMRPVCNVDVLEALFDRAVVDGRTEEAWLDPKDVYEDEEEPPTVPRPEFAEQWAKCMHVVPEIGR